MVLSKVTKHFMLSKVGIILFSMQYCTSQIKYIIHVLAISCLLLNAMPQKKASSDEK